jgi:hypothetical protein
MQTGGSPEPPVSPERAGLLYNRPYPGLTLW